MGPLAELTLDKLYIAGYRLSETMESIACYDFVFSVPAAGRCNFKVSEMTESMIRGRFDFLSKDIEKWASSSTTILADESYLNDVLSGLQNFKLNSRDVSIIEIEGQPSEMTF